MLLMYQVTTSFNEMPVLKEFTMNKLVKKFQNNKCLFF